MSMQIRREQHYRFLEDELRAETETFNRKFEAKASFLLEDTEEIYLAQYVKMEDGEMIVRFRNSRNVPRKGEHLYCMILPRDLRDYRNWGDKTYGDLFCSRYGGTECSTVWHAAADDSDFTLVGFRKVELDFADMLKDAKGMILAFAPQKPPTEYLASLQRVVLERGSKAAARILDAELEVHDWQPEVISGSGAAEFVLRQSTLSDTLILQGPPGTGKTYLIAQLCDKLCKDGKSVLVTAQTNRALMEIAEKPALRDMLKAGMIHKTNMTLDEAKELHHLSAMKQMMPMPGNLVLSTYFISSGFAADTVGDGAFDYVIMDEASQALTAMFAAAAMMGKKNIWVGDTKQLPPIVALNNDLIEERGYKPLIEGLRLMADCCTLPIYQLAETHRFGRRAASYTGMFYGNSLVSRKQENPADVAAIRRVLHPEGGPALILTDLPISKDDPEIALQMATYLTDAILQQDPGTEIGVLTCKIRTNKALQKMIMQQVGARQNVKVETIARVQGMTTDVTILVVPNASYYFSMEQSLFNVATSRAREHTIIIADKGLLNYNGLSPDVRAYLERLAREQCIYVDAQQPSAGAITGGQAPF